jgi:hypothetical protein
VTSCARLARTSPAPPSTAATCPSPRPGRGPAATPRRGGTEAAGSHTARCPAVPPATRRHRTAPELCAGITVTAERLRHATGAFAEQARWPPAPTGFARSAGRRRGASLGGRSAPSGRARGIPRRAPLLAIREHTHGRCRPEPETLSVRIRMVVTVRQVNSRSGRRAGGRGAAPDPHPAALRPAQVFCARCTLARAEILSCCRTALAAASAETWLCPETTCPTGPSHRYSQWASPLACPGARPGERQA